MDYFILFIDYFGTFVFAISGVLRGVKKQFDLFGVFILGFVTAVGGGTLRDILIGSTPVGWMKKDAYLLIIALAVPCCYFFKDKILKLKSGVFLFDTIGIGLFTILGLQKTLQLGLSPVMAVSMGIVSAVFGGVIRDVLSNEIPLIFRKEIYATACLFGALVYLACNSFLTTDIAMSISIICVIAIRIVAIKRGWALPFRV